MLKRLEEAEQEGDHIYGIVRGASVNHGGKTNGFTVPNPVAQEDVIVKALAEAGVKPEDISYLEAHGTGTSLGDPIEIAGLTRAYRRSTQATGFCKIGSAKSNIGHCESAAGIAGLTKILLQFKHQQLAPSIHSDMLNPNIDFDASPFVVNRELSDWKQDKPRIAGLSSFGAGGSNAHVIVQEYEPAPISVQHSGPYAIVLSARKPAQLMQQVKKLLHALETKHYQPEDIERIAYTLQVGREAFEHRIATVVTNLDTLKTALQDYSQNAEKAMNWQTGEVSKGKALLSEMPFDKHFQHAIQQWLKHRDYAQVLNLWVNGLEVNWALAETQTPIQRISLPTYPFEQGRYWFQASEVTLHSENLHSKNQHASGYLHPLVHANRSNVFDIQFSSTFTGAEPFLRDHQINDVPVLPGVAYLEMALIVMQEAFDTTDTMLVRDLTWLKPCQVQAPSNVFTQVDVLSEQSAALQFHNETVFSQCQVVIEPELQVASLSESGEDIFALLENVEQHAAHRKSLDIESFYQRFAEQGLDYGVSHRCVKSIEVLNYHTDTPQVWANVSLSSALSAQQQDYLLSPSLMDCALQVSLALSWFDAQGNENQNQRLSLPFAIEEVRVLATLPSDVFVWVRYAEGNASKDALEKLHIDIFDAQEVANNRGTPLVQIRGFSARLVETPPIKTSATKHTPKNEASHQYAPAALYRTQWQAVDAAQVTVEPETFAGLQRQVILLDDASDNTPAYESACIKEGIEVHLLPLTEPDSNSAWQVFERVSQALMANLQATLKSLPKGKDKQLIQVVIPPVSDALLQETLWGLSGLCRTVTEENSRLQIQLLSLGSEHHTAQSPSQRLMAQLQFALAAGYREIRLGDTLESPFFVRRFALLNVLEQKAESALAGQNDNHLNPLLVENAVYLITGGLGGLGYLFAQHIAQSQHPNNGVTLVLTGRSVLNTEGETKLSVLRELGATAEYHALDVVNAEAVEHIVADIMSRFGRLDFVLHSAGVLADSYLLKKNLLDAEKVLKPKVSGLANLDNATQHIALRGLVVFSSNSALGNPGQVDYAAANSFMDAYLAWRREQVLQGKRHGLSLSLNWPLWDISQGASSSQSVAANAMSVDPAVLAFMRKGGWDVLLAETGLEAYSQSLVFADTQSLSQVYIFAGQTKAITDFIEFSGVLNLSGVSAPETLITDAPTVVEYHYSEVSMSTEHHSDASSTESLFDVVSDFLVQQVCQLLKLQASDVDLETELSDYGFDSVTLTTFGHQVGDVLEINMPPTLFFEYPTLGDITEFLLSEHPSVMAKRFAVTEDVAPKPKPEPTGLESAASTPMTTAHPNHNQHVALTRERSGGLRRGIRASVMTKPSVSQTTPQNALPTAHAQPMPTTLATAAPESAEPGVAALHNDAPSSPKIAVVGISCEFPQASDVNAYWDVLAQGKDCITEIPESRWDWQSLYGNPQTEANKTNAKWGGFIADIDKFDPLFFGVSPREALVMDPNQRLLLTHVWKALEDAAITPSSLAGSNTAVLIGTAISGYDQRAVEADMVVEGYTATGVSPSLGPNRISYLLDIHGPSEPIETACSSALVAMHRAIRHLRHKECDLAITGGVNTLVSPTEHISFSKAGMLSEDGRCKTFAKDANGYVRGEGVGIVILKRLEDAQRDGNPIYACVLGSAENHGGRATSLTAPNVKAQTALLVAAYRDANVSPDSIGYIEAHGTGTPLGDPVEINSLKNAFSQLYAASGLDFQQAQNQCALGSVKTNIGHLELAAGIAGVIKVLLQLKHQYLAKSLHCQQINPYIELENAAFSIVQQGQAWPALSNAQGQELPRRAGVSSFGYGGVNAHVVLEEYSLPLSQREFDMCISVSHAPASRVVVLSAKTEQQLKSRVEQLLFWLNQQLGAAIDHQDDHHAALFTRLTYTLQVGREAYTHRLAFVASNLEDIKSALSVYSQQTLSNVPEYARVKRGDIKTSQMQHFETGTNAQTLVNAWLAGTFKDWRSQYPQPNMALPMLHLPTYPFAKEVYWITTSNKHNASASHSLGVSETALNNEVQHSMTSQASPSTSPTVTEVKVALLDAASGPLQQKLQGLEKPTPDAAKQQRYQAFDQLLLQWMWLQLEPLGLTVTAESWDTKTAISPMYQKWMHQCARIFRSNGFVTGLYTSPEKAVLDAKWQAFKAQDMVAANLENHVSLVWDTLSALPAIVTGQTPITDIMFPNSSMHKVEGIYKRNAQSDYFNFTVAKAVQTIAENHTGAPLRIVEIGAGTGGTTESVLSHLAGMHDRIDEYCYTDISRAFLIHAEKHYLSANPFINCQLLNVEKPLDDQPVKRGSYDIVIASNVLHATKDIDVTLTHLQQLMKYNGVLLLNELTQFSIFSHLTFGLTEGWWLANDPQNRIAGSPLLSPENWHNILTKLGFSPVQHPLKDDEALGQQVFIAHNKVMPEANNENNVEHRQESQKRSPSVGSPVKTAAYEKPNATLVENTSSQSVSTQMLAQDVRDLLRDVIASVLNVEEHIIEDDIPFSDYGVDSILAVNLVNTINTRCGLSLPTAVLFDYASVDRLLAYILKSHGEAVSATLSGTAPAQTQSLQQAQSQPVSDVSSHAADTHTATNEQAQPSSLLMKIAVIGMSGRFAQSQNIQALWQHLINGDDLVTPSSRWTLPEFNDRGEPVCQQGAFIDDIDKFDPWFFNISGTEAIFMEPQQRLFLQESWNALEDAGYACDSPYRQRTGVYVGCETSDYHNLFVGKKVPPQGFWGNSSSLVAARIAYFLDLQGPAMTLDTACSSSLSSIHIACQAIRCGDANMAIAGGVFLQSTNDFFYLCNNADMLSPKGHCHTFDSRADGFAPGEGVGALVLKPLDAAIADGDHIYATIVGSGMNQDGATNGITAPSANSQERLECEVYDRFGINPEHIQYVEAHGTGTILGDPIEYQALTKAFKRYTDKRQYCALGSIKSNMGHLATAAGVAGAIKTILCLHHKQLVPSLHFEQGNPAIDFENSAFYVNTEKRDWQTAQGEKRLAAISSFGFGGTNAHMVFEEAPDIYQPAPIKAAHLVVLSARSEAQLQQQVENLQDFLQANPETDLGHLSFTLLVARKHFEYRIATVARSLDELRSALAKWLQQVSAKGFASGSFGRIEAGFTGDSNLVVQQSLLRFGNQCLIESSALQSGAEYLENLSTIGHLFSQGYALDYTNLFAQGRYLRLSLPTYPFEKARFWAMDENLQDLDSGFSFIDNPNESVKADSNHCAEAVNPSTQTEGSVNASAQPSEILMMQPHWQDLPEDTKHTGFSAIQGSVLIVSACLSQLGDGWQVSAEALQSGIRSELAKATYPVNQDAVQCHALELPQAHLSEAINAFAVKLTRLLQACLDSAQAAPEQLILLLPDDPQSQLLRASYGLFGTAMAEAGDLKCSVLTLPANASEQTLVASVMGQIQHAQHHNNNHVRVVPATSLIRQQWRWDETELNNRHAAPIWQDGDVYLITGGLGGAGLALTQALVAAGHAVTVVLCGRTSAESLSEQQQNTLVELNKQAATVRYRSVDLGDKQRVQQLIADIQAEFGALHGILHSAGVNKDDFIVRKSLDDINAVLRPKVSGLIQLDHASAKEPLKFFVAFSSVAAIEGNVGQGDYAFANAFMDHYMRYRNDLVEKGIRSGASISVNWSQWQSGGMHIDAATTAILNEWGMYPMSDAQGFETLQNIIASGAGQYAVYCGDKAKIKQSLTMLTQAKPEPAAVLETSTIPSEQAQNVDAVEAVSPETPAFSQSGTEDLLAATLSHLTQVFSQVAKLPANRLKPTQSFTDYGMDSLIVTELNHLLGQQFGSLSKTLFYERDNLQAVSEYLVKGFPAQCQKWVGQSQTAQTKPEETQTAPQTEPQAAPNVDANAALENTALNIAALFSESEKSEPEQHAPARTAMNAKDIAIIGVAGRYPQAENIDQFWDNLKAGVNAVTEVPSDRWSLDNFYVADVDEAVSAGRSYSKWGGFIEGIDTFDSELFGISPREAQNMDPQERLFMEICWEVMEDAGYTPEGLAKQNAGNVGVFAGITKTGFELNNYAQWQHGRSVHGRTSFSSLANRVSFVFDFHGPSMPFDTMCSASLTAIHEACLHLRAGECNVAIAGGVNVYLHPRNYADMCFMRMLSEDGKCKSFGENGNGFVPGEGVGALLLKPLPQAEQDGDHIYALITASAVNHGGRTHGYTVPNPNAQGDLIANTLAKAGISGNQVSCIEAHGTGTKLGDPIEMTGLKQAFGVDEYASEVAKTCALGSVKSNIGHLEAAAGIASVTKVILQLKHQMLAPTLHAERENPNIDFKATPFTLQKRLGAWQLNKNAQQTTRIAGVSSFGAGSANAHVLLAEYAPSQAAHAPVQHEPNLPVAIVLSAKTAEQAHTLGKRLQHMLKAENYTDNELLSIAYTLQTGRVSMATRVAFVVTSLADLQTQLDIWLSTGGETGVIATAEKTPADEQAQIQDNLQALLNDWITGNDVDWQSLYTEQNLPKRVRLPSYPFDARKFAISFGQLDDIPERVGIENAGPAGLSRKDNAQQANAPVSSPLQAQNLANVNSHGFSANTQWVSPRRLVLDNVADYPAANAPQPIPTATPSVSAKPNTVELTSVTHLPAAKPVSKEQTKPAQIEPIQASTTPVQASPDSAAAETTESETSVSVEAITQQLEQSLEAHLMLDEGELETGKDFTSLGLDSVLGVEWIQQINRQFGTNIPVTALYDYPSPEQMAAHLITQMQPQPATSNAEVSAEEAAQNITLQILQQLQAGTIDPEAAKKQLSESDL
ncbi:SDR family NAD(P)-dependent oxidoreductase [Alteromonas sp. a30]|uniref:SDR family NAD(P)-dependent oxidoreductase n=1 Tax=Alteromonas sp. a30 TaxID=2730917 RepID=UPI00227F5010|nr:SDR family NAD(P)-dependent oxidoreductase [Alteromonas sp. a30]